MNNYNSNTMPFIAKIFEASTSHITKEDDRLIKQTVVAYKEGDITNKNLIVYQYEEGCFIFAAYEKNEQEEVDRSLKEEGYSNALINLLKKTRQHDCKYLQLDRDGIEYEDLPRFNW